MKSSSKPQWGELIQPGVTPWDNGIINLQSALKGRINLLNQDVKSSDYLTRPFRACCYFLSMNPGRYPGLY